jgi:hypothetical protein
MMDGPWYGLTVAGSCIGEPASQPRYWPAPASETLNVHFGIPRQTLYPFLSLIFM